MSVQAMNWVLEHSEAGGNARLVLISIANHADAEGTQSWPSMERIAKESKCSPATVKRALVDLRKMGELEWDSGGGKGRSNRYQMKAFRNWLNLTQLTGKLAHPDQKLAQSVTQTGSPVTQEPSLTVHNQDEFHSTKPEPLSDEEKDALLKREAELRASVVH